MATQLNNCYLSRHGVWYFRYVIPVKIIAETRVSQREVRRSLRTRSRKEAVRRAAYCRVRYDALFKTVMNNNNHDISEELEDEIIAALERESADTNQQFSVEPGIFASDERHQSGPTENEFRQQARGQLEFRAIKVEQQLDEERKMAIMRDEARKMELERGMPMGSLMTDEERTAPVLVSEAVTAYMERVLIADEHMSSRARNRFLSAFRYFLGLIGDMALQRITPQVGSQFYELMLRSSADVFRKERIKSDEPCDTWPQHVFFECDGDRVNPDRAKEKLNKLDQFVTWAFSEYGLAKGFDSLQDSIITPKQYAVERSDTKRSALSDDQSAELLQLDSLRRFIDHPTNAHRFWMPAIMAYSGCRNAEAAWLTPNGIIRDSETGIHCFSFCDEFVEVSGKKVLLRKVKSANSNRKVPIHTQLIKWGILEYWERAKKSRGQTYLFNSRKPGMQDSVTNGLSSAVTEALKELQIYEKGKVVAYSLRHRFINKLSEQGLSQPEIAYFVGHIDQDDKAAIVNTTNKYYLKHGSMSEMQKIVELVP